VSTDSNPWKEAILRSSIRHGHKFYEDDPEKSLEEARATLLEQEIRDRVEQQTESLNDEVHDLECENTRLEDEVYKLRRALQEIQELSKEATK
jgi:SMC interacting uncharacterized protein involved in chromosome segregation